MLTSDHSTFNKSITAPGNGREKMCISKKLDLGICGLLLTTFLFFLPGLIFLVLAFECLASNDDSERSTTGPCKRIDDETFHILIVFGCLFVIVGVLVCGFAVLIHRTNAKERQQRKKQNLNKFQTMGSDVSQANEQATYN